MEIILKKENQLVIIALFGVLLLFFMGIAFLVFFFLFRKKIVKKELEKSDLKINHQKEIIQSIIITQEEERKRIAQDLHDEISSKLNVINLNANLLKDGNLTKTEFETVNNGILDAAEKTLTSARKIAYNLLPPILEEFGFKDAVEELADSFNNSRKINIDYSINFPEKHFIPQNELHLFRITQELINNSVKHGKANNSNINITFKDQKIIFKYEDNGIGFNTNTIENKRGLGMKNIESRIALLNGKFSLNSEIGEGFKIVIVI